MYGIHSLHQGINNLYWDCSEFITFIRLYEISEIFFGLRETFGTFETFSDSSWAWGCGCVLGSGSGTKNVLKSLKKLLRSGKSATELRTTTKNLWSLIKTHKVRAISRSVVYPLHCTVHRKMRMNCIGSVKILLYSLVSGKVREHYSQITVLT